MKRAKRNFVTTHIAVFVSLNIVRCGHFTPGATHFLIIVFINHHLLASWSVFIRSRPAAHRRHLRRTRKLTRAKSARPLLLFLCKLLPLSRQFAVDAVRAKSREVALSATVLFCGVHVFFSNQRIE
jgi:hypothetical protein